MNKTISINTASDLFALSDADALRLVELEKTEQVSVSTFKALGKIRERTVNRKHHSGRRVIFNTQQEAIKAARKIRRRWPSFDYYPTTQPDRVKWYLFLSPNEANVLDPKPEPKPEPAPAQQPLAPRLLTAVESAQLARVSETTIYSWRRAGLLPITTVKIGKRMVKKNAEADLVKLINTNPGRARLNYNGSTTDLDAMAERIREVVAEELVKALKTSPKSFKIGDEWGAK
jgi:hypothetical protein